VLLQQANTDVDNDDDVELQPVKSVSGYVPLRTQLFMMSNDTNVNIHQHLWNADEQPLVQLIAPNVLVVDILSANVVSELPDGVSIYSLSWHRYLPRRFLLPYIQSQLAGIFTHQYQERIIIDVSCLDNSSTQLVELLDAISMDSSSFQMQLIHPQASLSHPNLFRHVNDVIST
jgi:hypothetical protein